MLPARLSADVERRAGTAAQAAEDPPLVWGLSRGEKWTSELLLLSCFLAFLLSCFLAFLLSCFLAFFLASFLACFFVRRDVSSSRRHFLPYFASSTESVGRFFPEAWSARSRS